MSTSWWQKAKGTMTQDSAELQKIIAEAGETKMVVVDFFMPDCYYCKKFYNEWNKIVDEFTAEYGPDQIMFVKVDGTQDKVSESYYQVSSYPTFIALDPGTKGKEWNQWKPHTRDYASMKKWLTHKMKAMDLHPLSHDKDNNLEPTLAAIHKL